MNDPSVPKDARKSSMVLSVGRDTLIVDGIDGFIMRRIAERAQMKLGNLQYYFATRDDLLEAILRSESAADLASLETAIRATPTTAEEEFTNTFAALARTMGGDKPNVYSLIGTLTHHNRQLSAAWDEMHELLYAVLARVIVRLDTSTTPTRAKGRAVLIMALIEGSTTQTYRATGVTSVRSVAQRVAEAAKAIALGL